MGLNHHSHPNKCHVYSIHDLNKNLNYALNELDGLKHPTHAWSNVAKVVFDKFVSLNLFVVQVSNTSQSPSSFVAPGHSPWIVQV